MDFREVVDLQNLRAAVSHISNCTHFVTSESTRFN
jgi:hypothetical protein